MENNKANQDRTNFYVTYSNRLREYYKHLWWVLPVTLLILGAVYFWQNATDSAENGQNSVLPTNEEAIELDQPSDIVKEGLEEVAADSID